MGRPIDTFLSPLRARATVDKQIGSNLPNFGTHQYSHSLNHLQENKNIILKQYM
jgi:hypothetical protein